MPQIKIASFNVNSIRARLPNILAWIKNSNPDIILLQELKCLESEFPFEALFDAGYNSAVSGQKTYNGVAILSKFKIEDVVKSLPTLGGRVDEQARYIEATIPIRGKAIRVASVYVPNGGGEIREDETLESSEKFCYKLDFFERLKAHFSRLLAFEEMQIFGGDFNVAAEEIDVFDPQSLNGTVCFHPLERQKFRSILNLGLVDSYRAFNRQSQAFTWWDYRGGGWQHNKGMRIDYLLASPKAADRISDASIEDKGVRDQEKASDHCPTCIELSF
jgi:exodeoxyribonuclease-3